MPAVPPLARVAPPKAMPAPDVTVVEMELPDVPEAEAEMYRIVEETVEA